jgi:two-component system sensor histidine kinase AlgZ
MMNINDVTPDQESKELLIPDYCNVGIVVRVLAIVNVVVLLGLLARGFSWNMVWKEFIESAMLVELICLFSLIILCGFRQLLERQYAPNWMQRIVCGTIPALVCFISIYLLMEIEWFSFSFPNLHIFNATLICFIMGLGMQYYFELRTKAFSPALGEARLQALQARIRPHFLFNSLNAVLTLIRSEPRRAETALEDLADLFRVLMRDTRKLTTLREEITLCEQYLGIEKIRLGDRLQVTWTIENLNEAALISTKIAALLLQPLIENAVHYGIEPVAKGGVITVKVERVLEKIEIKVVNSFHLHARLPQGNHMALDNIKQRLKLLYDIEASLSTSIVGDMFEVKLIFPANS